MRNVHAIIRRESRASKPDKLYGTGIYAGRGGL